MRVAPIRAQEVEVKTTRASPAELRAAIASAYVKVTGKQPTSAALDAISAQAMVETGRGTSMVNYNFGGIKGASPEGMTTRAKTIEVEHGKVTHIVDKFRAYGSLEAGATDYVRLLHDRFSSAFAKADAGDIDGFAHELKRAHYFTASETDYAAALHAQAGASSHAHAATVAPAPGLDALAASTAQGPDRFARAEQISRILDALNVSASRILDDSNDESILR